LKIPGSNKSWIGWLFLAGPAIAQLVLLAIAIVGRYRYPYDLEWMEGGLLHHAQRVHDGVGIYGPPSVGFIPYLYTPLYPGLLAVLGPIFGLSYQLGRMISILSLIGIFVLTMRIVFGATRGGTADRRAIGFGGGLFAIGLFCAGYPYTEGWYDLVRGDTLFLVMATGGLALAYATANTGTGVAGHARTAAAAAVLALSFFCKQTGIAYVAAGGLIVLVTNWRRIFVYVFTAGAIGLGGVALLDRATDHWFWTYIFEVHQAHDWNVDRYWMSFDKIAGHLPAVTILVQATGVAVLATWAVRRTIPPESKSFLLWGFVYLVSTWLGATSWATEFAVYNSYMPAFLHGAIAAGLALPTLAACTESLTGKTRWGTWVAVIAALGLAAQCIFAWWHPSKFIPTDDDRSAGDRLIARIAAVDGEVWVPSHPWYAHLAGKPMYVHRMGIKDVTTRQNRKVFGLDDALDGHKFAAVFLDSTDVHLYGEVPALNRNYQEDVKLPSDERPRTFSGATSRPDSVWVPIGPPVMPPGTRVLCDFEGKFDFATAGWTMTGKAWGSGAVGDSLPGQGPVRRAGGRQWASSMHGGDDAVGSALSPVFTIDGATLAMRLGGGTDDGLRVELVIDGKVERTAQVKDTPSDRFVDTTIDVSDLKGKQAQLRLVDESTAAWGHLNVDEIWIEP
jgi:hypothetical protein